MGGGGGGENLFKLCSSRLGPLIKMADMPIYVKNTSTSSPEPRKLEG